jgi:hypothetical protein
MRRAGAKPLARGRGQPEEDLDEEGTMFRLLPGIFDIAPYAPRKGECPDPGSNYEEHPVSSLRHTFHHLFVALLRVVQKIKIDQLLVRQSVSSASPLQ